jgi:hypothetical protein
MQLRTLAHVRTGDKGNVSQISVIGFSEDAFAILMRELTEARLREHLSNVRVTSVRRYELPQLWALNFVLEGALNGGVTRSLSLDAHGKTLGSQLLDMIIVDAPGSPREFE